MKFGFYTDKGIDRQPLSNYPWNKTSWHPDLNSHGYRCPEWSPMPDGKKNVVVLGCSHTFGQGLYPGEHWVDLISKHWPERLRYWNLGVPGASGDCCVRRLWGSQKIIDPRVVIICWPDISRRAWYGESEPTTIMGSDDENRYQTKQTDTQVFLQNVFWVQKYGEIFNAKIFHCFSSEYIDHPDISKLNVLKHYTIKNCWPHWDRQEPMGFVDNPSFAMDGEHYGREHHERFAKLFLKEFQSSLK